MKVINFSDARNRLKNVFDEVSQDVDYTVISRRDAEDVVVLSLDYFNSLIETSYCFTSPKNAEHLARSIKQYQSMKHDD